MDHRPGKAILHEDEHCTCRVEHGRVLVAPKRPFSSWWDASAAEREALLRAIAVGRGHLIGLRSDYGVQITWREPPAACVPAIHLQIEVAAASSADSPPLDRAPHQRGLIRGEQDPLLDHLAASMPTGRRSTERLLRRASNYGHRTGCGTLAGRSWPGPRG